VTVLDVGTPTNTTGQGEAILIQSPGGATGWWMAGWAR
jgi:hypothetical protein